MTHVYERIFLACPYARARDYIRDALEPAARALREENVLVSYERGQDLLRFDEPWRVRWTSVGTGAHADFTGEITVCADESYRYAVLELNGDYVLPRTAQSGAYDMMRSIKTVRATARALLAQTGANIDARYEQEERGMRRDRIM